MKEDIDSLFFEFQKMYAFLQLGVGMHLGNFRFVPIQPAQNYVYSILLVDLFSIVDNALVKLFEREGLDPNMKLETRMLELEEKGLILNAPYFKWYKSWRNEIAHRNRKIEYFELNQAYEDVQKQLVFWKMVTDLKFSHYHREIDQDIVLIGSRIGDIPILEYRVRYIDQPLGKSPSWNVTINLSLIEFLDQNNG